MNIRNDTKNLQMLLDDNRKHKNGTDAIKEFHKMHEYIIKLEAKVENLTIDSVRVSDLDLDALAKVIVKQKVSVKGKEFLQIEEKHILHKSSRDITSAVIEYLHSL
tara:strand:- start:608 stop:925 length:318 start_codon:yes stop_codon:yes gene_type:complete